MAFNSGDAKIFVDGRYVGEARNIRIHNPSVQAHIRWMIRRDMNEVLRIEKECFEFPWGEEDFVRCLRQRNCIGMVAENTADDSVVGFMIYELHRTRLHLLSFAVAKDVQWRGVGRQMIQKLQNKLSHQRRSRILCEVRETNVPAQFFFKACGFRAISILNQYYQDTDDAAYLFQFRFPLTPPIAKGRFDDQDKS